jgi:tetratricopeptide (TPR) repeat protein
VARFLEQDYAAAETAFRQVQAVQPDRQNVGYYLGFLEYRKQNYREALRFFRQNVPSDDTFAQLSRFYAGLSLSALGLAGQARAEIEEALRLQPVSPLTGPAERFRDVLGAAAQAERAWRIDAKLSFFYDDNVTVNPKISNDPTAEASRAKDHRSTGELGFVRFEYLPLRTPDWEASLSYGLLQTVNNEVSDNNIQNHTLAGTLAYKTSLSGLPTVASLTYQYDYVSLDDRSFVSRHTVAPGGTLVWNAMHLTQAQGRIQFKDFLHERGELADPTDRRDAFNYLAGFTHYLRFQADRHYLRGGYQFDWEQAEGRNWDYLGHRLLLGGQYTAPWDLRLRYDFDVHFRDYRHLHAFLPTGIAAPAIHRIDRDMNHLFSVSKDLPHNLNVAVEYLLNRSSSNLAVYDYTRNVISLSVSWRY